MTQNDGVTASPPGSQASPEAASCTASSPSVSIPNATEHDRLVQQRDEIIARQRKREASEFRAMLEMGCEKLGMVPPRPTDTDLSTLVRILSIAISRSEDMDRINERALHWREVALSADKKMNDWIASAMSAGTAETPVEAAQGGARQRDGEAGTPEPTRPSTPDEMGDAQ